MFSPERLKQARLRRGLTKVSLAAQVNLTPRRLSSFENEDEVPPDTTLSALAHVLKFPIGFFSLPSPTLITQDDVSFRSLSRLPARKRDAALAGAALASEVASWMEEQFELPIPNLPDMRDLPASEAATSLRSIWGLGELAAPNMIHLMEAFGVRVFSLVDDCKALDAMSSWIEDRPFVFLTNHKSPERARWDAAHELGHLVLHLGSHPHGKEHEDQADEFAGEFLMPERGFRSRAPRFPSLQDVRSEKLIWEVSAMAYIRRLHHLQIISDWTYKSLVIEASHAGYRRKEGDIDRETSKLIPQVLDALQQEGISTASIAKELNITKSELRGLLFSPLSAVGTELTTQVAPPSDGPRAHLSLIDGGA